MKRKLETMLRNEIFCSTCWMKLMGVKFVEKVMWTFTLFA